MLINQKCLKVMKTDFLNKKILSFYLNLGIFMIPSAQNICRTRNFQSRTIKSKSVHRKEINVIVNLESDDM